MARRAQRKARSEAPRVLNSRRTPEFLIFAGLAGLALLAYLPLLTNPTGLLWDDAGHVTRAGLRSLDGLRRIWFEVGATQQYYPIVHSAFWLQARLWGDNLTAYHTVNILLHSCSAYLVTVILRRLSVAGAILAGVLFAVHPVHVESVAWISELKNTLSCVFFLLAALLFLRFDEERSPGTYTAALAMYVLAVLSKSVTATLPVGLLVVLWHRHGRPEWKRHLLPLLPFLVVGIAAGALTVWFEHSIIGAEGDEFHFGAIERTLIAGRALWFYVAKLFWPVALSFNYPRWTSDASSWWQYLFPVGAVAAIGILWWRRMRGTLAGVLFFCVTVAPALGFVNVYPFRFSFVADHFQYHASIGLLAVLAAGLSILARRLLDSASAVWIASLIVVLPLLLMTRTAAAHYVNDVTLYRATLAANPGSWLAHLNLATILVTGSPADVREAETHAREALRLKPDYLEAHYNLGAALELQGRYDDAIAEYRRVIADAPARQVPLRRLASIERRLGLALHASGRTPEGITELERAVTLDPQGAASHADLGLILAEGGRPETGLPHLLESVRLDPRNADYQINLGTAYVQLGRAAEAIEALSNAVRVDPANADAFHNLGAAYALSGRYQDAAAAYREAIRLRPNDARAQAALAAVLSRIR